MFNKLIETQPGKIYAFLMQESLMRYYLINKLLDDLNADNKVMLWQSNCTYHDCKREQMYFNADFNEMWDNFKDKFTTLIISYCADWANNKEIVEFMQRFKQDATAKDKSLVIFFKVKRKDSDLKIEDFVNLGQDILANCDEIYTCNGRGIIEVEEVCTEQIRYFQQTMLDKAYFVGSLTECDLDKVNDHEGGD